MNDRSTIAVVRRRRRSASRRPSAPLLPCPPAPLLPLPSAPRLRRGGGFSFAEVLFAVIILGIGFILVAAIFPVAIQQTQATVDDAAAAVAARGAASVIAAVPTTIPNPVYLSSPTAAQLSANPAVAVRQLLLFPPTVKNFIPTNIPPQMAADVPPPAIVVPFTGPRAALVAGNLINATDPRFAYVPFYRRENRSTTAQLIVIAIAARNRPVYDSTVDAAVPGPTTPMTGYAGPGGVITAHGTGVTDQVVSDQFTFSLTPPAWVCEGCALATNSASGRAYRLGRALSLVSPPKSFELDAGDASSVAAGPDGLWGTADDIRDVVGNFNGVLPPSTVQPVGAYARIFGSPGSIGGRITLSIDLGHAVASETAIAMNMPDTSNLLPGQYGTPPGQPLAVPGAFVIVADDDPYDPAAPTNVSFTPPPNTATLTVGRLNGHIFRLGAAVPADASATPRIAPGTFELDPQYETVPPGTATLVPTTGDGGPRARVYLVGAGRTNALSATDATSANAINTLTTYSGPAQDVGVYTTLFPVQ